MKARFIDFGEIEIDGQRYDYDVVIDEGGIRKRKKKPSKAYREQFGHTPLSTHEEIPWGGKRLIVGTGAYGKLPIMHEVLDEAKQRGIEIVAVLTDEACRLVSTEEGKKVRALLHVTC
ncbi:MAG: MTH938/NDUFAF3 family protein [bacterium]